MSLKSFPEPLAHYGLVKLKLWKGTAEQMSCSSGGKASCSVDLRVYSRGPTWSCGAVFSWAGRIKFLESRLLRQCSSPTIGDEGTSMPPHPMEVDQLPGSLGQTMFWTAGAAGLTEAYSSERAARCAMNSCYFLRSCFIAACPTMSVNVSKPASCSHSTGPALHC